MSMKDQIAFRLETDLRSWVETLRENRPGGQESLGEFMRAAVRHECERRDPEQEHRPPAPDPGQRS